MKSLQKLFLLSITVFYFAGCASETTVNESPESNNDTTTETTHHNHDADEQITLNNGEKWKVDEHMLGFIRSIEKDVTEFSKSTGEKALTNYHHLSEKIAGNLDSLTSNCTMTGQAHDELHKWLLPFLDLNEYFSASETIAEADSLFTEVSASFQEFNTYFE